MDNPLLQLKTAAQGLVRNVVASSFDSYGYRISRNGCDTDDVFSKYDMDTLRRCAYRNVFSKLFLTKDQFPYVTPDTTLKEVINKLKDNVFPTGSRITSEDDTINQLVQKIIAESKFRLKAEEIVEESALMGYCAIRSVFNQSLNRWVLDIKPKEYLVIERVPGTLDEYEAIGMEWPIDRDGKRYWQKERWTKAVYQIWPEILEKVDGKKPVFDPEDAVTEPNNYGEIPYTLIPHFYDSHEIGRGIVQEEQVLSVKALIRLRHKRHYGHLKYMDPNPVIKNRRDAGDPIDLSIGKVIDITSQDENMPVDMQLLEFAGMPDSVDGEKLDHVASLYRAAGLKPPPPEDQNPNAAGTSTAGVALRLLDKDDAKTIETLRDNGYSNVIRHFEKLLRMGKNLNISEYASINTEDEDSYRLSANYPDFFPPTDQDVAMKLANMNAAALPIDIKTRMIASLFGIEDEKELAMLKQELEDKKNLEQALLQGGGF